MLIIVFGLPGSGKSFFASRLANLVGAEYIKSDSVREECFSKRYTLISKMQVYQEMLRRTKKLLSEKSHVVVDATFYQHEIRKKFKDECEALEKIYFIEVRADESAIRERLKTTRIDSDADFEVYRKIKAQWEPLTEDHLVLQSTNNNIEEMLELATDYLHLKNDKRSG